MFRQFYDSFDMEGNYEFARLEDGLREMILSDCIFESAMSKEWVEVEGRVI